jgi:alkylation response protein AidB-like acyl-CoA dehydrogenase
MGLHALYNAVISFKDVVIPRENIVLAEGKGLRVALTTLNTGRLTLPAACVGLGKRCLDIAKTWANERVQWGSPIGHHAAIADKIAKMAADIFAMEAMTMFTAALVDRHDGTDIRLEAAMCKMWGTETAWDIVHETLAIRGGRGFETAQSLKARGETGIPIERFLRDSRINLIFEGSSEIMRLFIAREALDTHLKIGGAVLNSRLPASQRGKAALKAAAFYAGWYPKQLLEIGSAPRLDEAFAEHAQFVGLASHKLARKLFHAMVKFGPKLEKQQVLLSRFVEIGTELFAMAATISRAEMMIASGSHRDEVIPLADYFCRASRVRIDGCFRGTQQNNDRAGYLLARTILDGKYAWMNDGIV